MESTLEIIWVSKSWIVDYQDRSKIIDCYINTGADHMTAFVNINYG